MTFTSRLIIHRNAIKAKLETANDPDKPTLKSDEQGIKILANATSYGIFVELNVEDYVTAKPMIGYGGRRKPSHSSPSHTRRRAHIFIRCSRH